MKILNRCATGMAFALLAHAAPAALLPQGVSVTTEATYNGAASGPLTVTDTNPGAVNSASIAGPGGGGIGPQGVPPQTPLDTFDEAIASGRALLPGTVGSFSHAGGFSPGFGPGPDGVFARASASQVTHWTVVTTVPGATTVDIDVAAFYDGSLLTSDFAGVPAPGQLYASVEAGLEATDANGQSLYAFDATATMDSVSGFTSSANWAGDFNVAFNPGTPNDQATVNYFAFFDNAFTVQVGEVFAWESSLATEAFAGGAFELWGIADFFNTGDGVLSIDTPGFDLVQVPVPLPAGLPLLAGGLVVLRYARRRNDSSSAS